MYNNRLQQQQHMEAELIDEQHENVKNTENRAHVNFDPKFQSKHQLAIS
jgi:hypothetical protein